MPKLDWDAMEKADQVSREPAPGGRYVLKVDKASWGKSKKGIDQVTVIARIDEGPFKGKPVWNYMTFDPDNGAAVSMARDFLRILGQDFGPWGKMDERQQLEVLIGRRFEAELNVNEFQGRKSNKIKQLIRGLTGPSGSSAPTPPPPVEGGTEPAKPRNPIAPPAV